MPLGPVGSSVKDIAEFSTFLDIAELDYAGGYIQRGDLANTVVSIADVDSGIFSKSEIEALDFAYSEFGSQTAPSLVNITHRYPEWSKFKSALDSKETTRESMSYKDFFGNPVGGPTDKFALDNEVLSASKELFEEDHKIAEYWK
jgi:hypothetical protein